MLSFRTIFLLLALLPAVVDALCNPAQGGGSFVCNICGDGSCNVANRGKNIIVGSGIGSITCGALYDFSQQNCLNPQECSAAQQVVMATSNPCNCRANTGGQCEKPGFTANAVCNLCNSGQFLGDPDKVITNSLYLSGTTCREAWDSAVNGFLPEGTICNAARADVRNQCQCVAPGQIANTCLPVEDTNFICNTSSNCCSGTCKKLNSHGKDVCTTRTTGVSNASGPISNAPPSFVGLVACFSEETLVTTEDKGQISMKKLKIGDKIMTSANKFETVYSFGHRDEDADVQYMEIWTENSKQSLQVSRDHMVFVKNNRAVPASMLSEGDSLVTSSGESSTITRIGEVTGKGAYAPFTMSGSLVVNDVVASSFISMQEPSAVVRFGSIATPFSWQWVAHLSETPHRIAYRIGFGVDGNSADGVSQWDPYNLAKWIIQQNGFVMALILLPAMSLCSLLWVFEQYLVPASSVFVLLIALIVIRRRRKSESSSEEKPLYTAFSNEQV